jgi:hypothetical protein
LTPSDLFIPIETRVASTWNERSRRNSIWLKMIARLRPGVERTAAEAALAVPYMNALQKDLIAHPRDAVTASLVGAKLVESQLYGIQSIEPGIIAAAALTIVLVSALAVILPALRAMRIDPIRALRHE